MVQFLPNFFFLGFLQFLLGFSKVPVFLCHHVYQRIFERINMRYFQFQNSLPRLWYRPEDGGSKFSRNVAAYIPTYTFYHIPEHWSIP